MCPNVNGTVDFIWSCDVLTGAAHVSFVLVYSLKKKESYFLAVVLSGSYKKNIYIYIYIYIIIKRATLITDFDLK